MSEQISTIVQFVTLLFAAGALVVAVVLAITRGASPAEIDADVSARIDAIRREHIRVLEKQYSEATAMQRQLVDTLGALVQAVAPLTAGKADDKLAEFIDDIQTTNSAPAETAAAAEGKREAIPEKLQG